MGDANFAEDIRKQIASEPEQLSERMGVRVTDIGPGRVVGTMPVAGNRQPYGILHGEQAGAGTPCRRSTPCRRRTADRPRRVPPSAARAERTCTATVSYRRTLTSTRWTRKLWGPMTASECHGRCGV